MVRFLLGLIVCLALASTSAYATNVRPTYLEEKYQVKIAYDGSDNPEYIGKSLEPCAANESCWQILKITYSGANPTDIQYCNGTHAFTGIWDNRASCSYS